MATVEKNDFSSPDEVRTQPKTKVDVVNVAGSEIGRYTFQPGWRWSDDIKPAVGGDSCQTDHVGYLVSGTMGLRTDDGTETEIQAGSVYHIPSGHDGWVVGDAPVVTIEFKGAANYAKS